MAHAKRVGSTAAAGLTMALLVTACGGGGGTGATQQTGSQPQQSASGVGGTGDKGGTITLYHATDFEHLDPQRNFVTDSGMFGQLLYRTLMAYRYDPATKKIILENDLAQSVSKSGDFKTWTFKLKPGLKYEDGTLIVAKDIKYGVERSFSPDLAEGAPYARNFLACQAGYKGPYSPVGNNGGKGCTAITAPDDNTVVFKLKEPVGDFDATATLKTFSPVPQVQDKRVNYDSRPFSSGPYKVETYQRKKSLTLVRNTNWDQSSDPIRSALPDKWSVRFGDKDSAVSQRLINNAAADQAAISFGSLEPQALPRLTNPNVKNRVVQGPDTCRRYLAINQQKIPVLKNLNFRKALLYATSKQGWVSGRGGTQLNKPITSIIPDSLPGYLNDPTVAPVPLAGDLAKAKQFLAQSGYKGEKLVLGTSNASPEAIKGAEALQSAYRQLGVKVDLKKINGDNYYSEQQNDKSATDLIIAGWCPDWAALSTIVDPVFGEDGANPGKAANNNYARYIDKANWAKMDQIGKIADFAQAQVEWGKLYLEIMKDVPVIPLSLDNNIYIVGGKIANAHTNPDQGGLIDVAQVGIKK